jgi:hypothetical protein
VPPREVPSKSDAVVKVAEKHVVAKAAAETKLAAIADVGRVMVIVHADREKETAIVLADLARLAKVMANVQIVATAPSVVIVDPAKVVVADPALVVPIVAVQAVVDLLKVLDEKVAQVAPPIQKSCLLVSTRTAMAS